MEDRYLKLLERIMHVRDSYSLESAIVEAHKVVAAKRKFENTMYNAFELLDETRALYKP